MKQFGNSLKQLRHKMGLRQNDMAKILGVERSTLANWERGAKLPSLETLMKLRETFGVSLDELVGIERSITFSAPVCHYPLSADPVVKLLAKQTGVPAKAIAAFITAFRVVENNCENHHEK
ncbi:MAG: helix-turn-helix transcriptional regulator [Syntrophothermus sp.]|uniref:helix-turn-helix domain-containing protein n=1 Tax=Syntrophothermus sp. TaxID=2736299 RepID=UPI00257C8679|nr:helix-turn-helix transcriptional regulator [Syntrophothermus sp.]NSW84195.1 helix-turn-helix transcriptional regulator [Syntrophothermus sp.]